MAKKKILYLVTQSEWGGAQEYIFNLALSLDKNQFTVLVLAGEEGNSPAQRNNSPAQRDDEFFRALEDKNLSCRKLKWTKRALNPVFDLLALIELIFVFNKEKPDVIHLNSSKIGFLGSLAGKIYNGRAKIIYTAHGWVFTEPLPCLIKKLYFWIEKISAAWKDAIITVCEADRRIALNNNFKTKAGKFGADQVKIITITNAINPEQLNFLPKNEARNLLKLAQNDLVIGTIANLYKTKGLNFLIEAINLLKNDFKQLKTVIIGEGEEKQKLKNLIAQYNLQNQITLTGSLPEAHKYLPAFDLFVLASVKEGLPYALLKAQAAGLPIVATAVGGVAEIIEQPWLVEPKNPQQLAKKITAALNQGPLPLKTTDNHQFLNFLKQTFSLY